ncbi:MAG: hypothetical protein GXO03_00290 [Aquificae bacterium]|nr:hypothetical protein [Aquificota bacterium]
MKVELKVELYRGRFLKLGSCRGVLEVKPVGGALTEALASKLIKEKVVEALKAAGFRGEVIIDGERFKL